MAKILEYGELSQSLFKLLLNLGVNRLNNFSTASGSLAWGHGELQV
jgi:hypothetical protein